MRMHSPPPRQALTLLEVIVSMAIFLLSMVAIWQLGTLGSERALEVKYQARTSMRCQAKLDEIMVGADSLTSGGYNNFTDDANKDLQWMLDAKPADSTGLWNVTVAVKYDLPTGKSIESKLSRMIIDPSIRGSTADQPNPVDPPNPTQDAPAQANAGTQAAPALGAGGGVPANPKAGGAGAGGGNKGGGKGGGVTTPPATKTPATPPAATKAAGGKAGG